jgi:integrase
VLEREHFNKFLEDAPDKIYLLIKVALVMGIGGGCRMDELHKMKIDDIEDRDNILIIQVPETKTNKKRMFTIVDNTKIGVSKLALYKKYSDLRPANTPTKSFFLGYRNEKCTKQVVGINTFYKMPRMIAEFLKLPLPESYTGHCFRRSSATLLANTGANTLMMKRHGGWKSNSVVEGYIDESVENKKEICNRILMGTSSTKNCQGFSNELPGCSGANLIKSEDVVNFIKSKDVANENTVKCGGKVFKKCTFNFY